MISAPINNPRKFKIQGFIINSHWYCVMFSTHKICSYTTNSSVLLVSVSITTFMSIKIIIHIRVLLCLFQWKYSFCHFFCAFAVFQFGFMDRGDRHNEILTAFCITRSLWCSSCWSLLWNIPHWCWISGYSVFESS